MGMAIVCKSTAEIDKMRHSGSIVRQVLDHVRTLVAPGITTMDLERAAEKKIAELGAKPAFKGYYDYPCVLCTSVNEEIVHGIPSEKRMLKAGDIVSIDCGVVLDGYYGDSATTVAIGDVGEQTRKLMRVTQESLELAIQQVRAGNRLFDICGSVERHVTANGFSIVREYVGHGIGTQLHEEPQIPNYIERKNENPRLKEGMVLAIEPMVNAGKPDTRVLKDKWTAVTRDGSCSAHFEHCVAVTSNGPWVLTRP